MTVVNESATPGPRDWIKSRLSALLAPNRVAGNQNMNAANDADYHLRQSRQHMLHSRHTH